MSVSMYTAKMIAKSEFNERGITFSNSRLPILRCTNDAFVFGDGRGRNGNDNLQVKISLSGKRKLLVVPSAGNWDNFTK